MRVIAEYPSLQASLRNLVLDVTPSEQLASANAWHGRFNHVGNIVGFTLGRCEVVGRADTRLSEPRQCANHPAGGRRPVSQR